MDSVLFDGFSVEDVAYGQSRCVLIYKPCTRAECGCEMPHDPHPPPKNEEAIQKPRKRPCCFHLVNRGPTEEDPYPFLEKCLGSDVPVKSLRRRLVRRISTHAGNVSQIVNKVKCY